MMGFQSLVQTEWPKGLLNLRFRNSKGAEKVRRDERSRVTEDVGRV